MGLFSKKPKPRFEAITIDREREVFRALEDRGWILCDEPFQIELQKPAEKLRKDALAIAKDLKGELIVEVFDPIFTNMPWRGLRYAVWRKATPMEIQERMRKKKQGHDRPDYKDTMGSIEDIARKLDEKKIKVSEEDLHALDSIVQTEKTDVKGDLDGKTREELMEAENAIKAISTFDPYEHQGEEGTVPELEGSGPVFQQSIELETDEALKENNTEVKDIDAMAMMMEAAESGEIANVTAPAPPDSTPPPSPPAAVPEGELPQITPPPQPPQTVSPPSPPANAPQGGVPQQTAAPQPPAAPVRTSPPAPLPREPGTRAEKEGKEQGT
ncbi:hypothetical protein B6U90_01755 [Thermoplasmatales archaeon ex4484_6]|nr:MAG: hypothetical protein B6U90_01755 [Thermoplasmatales archaeon ex4484_6]RLF68949.1 MAG: hypothetical protein DRN57_02440 [Thermoplasmata archaeon]